MCFTKLREEEMNLKGDNYSPTHLNKSGRNIKLFAAFRLIQFVDFEKVDTLNYYILSY